MRILTFDIEDWFHVLDNAATDSPSSWLALESRVERNTDRILEELAPRGVRATFFCLGWVAEHHAGAVRRIAAQGHELGTHSYAHLPLHRQRRHEFEADLTRSLRLLEDISGQPVTCYRAPGFSLLPAYRWAFDALIANGISVDCSMLPFRRTRGRRDASWRGPVTIESTGGRLREIPISSGRMAGMEFICSGAGYFRLLPYGLVRDQLRRHEYAMTYFHPRDFDAGQPMVDGLSVLRRFKARLGLRTAFARFRRLLDDFDFVSVGEAVQRIDWAARPVVSIAGDATAAAPPLTPYAPGRRSAG